jgi:hypothetical protein
VEEREILIEDESQIPSDVVSSRKEDAYLLIFV